MDRWLAANTGVAGACCESVPGLGQPLPTDRRHDLRGRISAFHRHQRLAQVQRARHGAAARSLSRGRWIGTPYGRFAEMLLAAALRDAGHQLGYARESIVDASLSRDAPGVDRRDRRVRYERVRLPGREPGSGPRRPFLPAGHAQPVFAGVHEPSTATVASTLLAGTSVATHVRCAKQSTEPGESWPGSSAAADRCLPRGWRSRRVELRCWWNRHDSRRVDQPYRELVRLASVLSRVRFLASQPVVDSALPDPSTVLAIDALARVGTPRLPRSRTDERSAVPMVEAHRRDSAPPEAWRLSTPPHHWRNPSREIESSRRVQRQLYRPRRVAEWRSRATHRAVSLPSP